MGGSEGPTLALRFKNGSEIETNVIGLSEPSESVLAVESYARIF